MIALPGYPIAPLVHYKAKPIGVKLFRRLISFILQLNDFFLG
jgi:hypothetical protein